MKIIRATTIPLSLTTFCGGLLTELREEDGYDVVALSSPGPELDALGRNEGVRTIGVKMRRDIAPLADLRALLRLVRVLRREKPDLIHTMTPKAGLLGMMAARIAGVPVRLHTFTGLLFPTATGLRRHLLKFTDRLTCLAATHINPEGQGVATDLREAGITKKPLRVLANGNVRGVDPDHLSPTPDIIAAGAEIRRRLGIPADAFVFIFIGRFVGDKGLRELLTVFPSLPPTAHLVLVGATDGSRDDIPAGMLAGNGRIHLSGGWVDDVRPWLAMADTLVFPSYREGFPNVVLEAGAMSIPSIVTDINGSREIITSGHNGLVIPPRTTAPLLEAMTAMLSLPTAYRRAMDAAARADVLARFTTTTIRYALRAFYREILPNS